MRKNRIGYLGIIGFLGLVGLITGNFGFYGFFGFFGFFSVFAGRDGDERAERNINRVCRDAFVFTTVTSVFSLAYIASFKAMQVWPLALSLPFFAIVLFALSCVCYDRRGD